MPGQRLAVPAGHLRAVGEHAVEAVELAEPDRGLDVGHAGS